MTRSEPEENPSEAPSDLASRVLALLWIALFGGRYAVVPLLQWNGLLQGQQIVELDEKVLLRVYLVLFAATVLTLALRFVRGRPSETARPHAVRSDERLD